MAGRVDQFALYVARKSIHIGVETGQYGVDIKQGDMIEYNGVLVKILSTGKVIENQSLAKAIEKGMFEKVESPDGE